MERFISILIEHTAGKFPLWLAPEQIAILPVGEGHVAYANTLLKQLALKDIRGYVDDRSETVGRKIRDTELKKIPIMLIIGDDEVAGETVAVRKQGEGDQGKMDVDSFVSYFNGLLAD
jgi:threonyl-tRNA synthetase